MNTQSRMGGGCGESHHNFQKEKKTNKQAKKQKHPQQSRKTTLLEI